MADANENIPQLADRSLISMVFVPILDILIFICFDNEPQHSFFAHKNVLRVYSMISKSWQNLDSLFDEMNSDELKIKNNHCFCVNSAHNLIYITGAGYNKYYEEKFILITLQVSNPCEIKIVEKRIIPEIPGNLIGQKSSFYNDELFISGGICYTNQVGWSGQNYIWRVPLGTGRGKRRIEKSEIPFSLFNHFSLVEKNHLFLINPTAETSESEILICNLDSRGKDNLRSSTSSREEESEEQPLFFEDKVGNKRLKNQSLSEQKSKKKKQASRKSTQRNQKAEENEGSKGETNAPFSKEEDFELISEYFSNHKKFTEIIQTTSIKQLSKRSPETLERRFLQLKSFILLPVKLTVTYVGQNVVEVLWDAGFDISRVNTREYVLSFIISIACRGPIASKPMKKQLKVPITSNSYKWLYLLPGTEYDVTVVKETLLGNTSKSLTVTTRI